MFVNLHLLFSFAAGNPNRDDTGSPKTCSYGGGLRGRVSSQAMSRPKRLYYEEDREDRTSRSGDRIITAIVESTVAVLKKQRVKVDANTLASIEADAGVAIRGLYASAEKNEAKKQDKQYRAAARAAAKGEEAPAIDDTDSGAKSTLVWLSQNEIDRLAYLLAKKYGKNGDRSAVITGSDFLSANASDSLAIAAFGRMFAAQPALGTDSAIQRSHAITTHEIEIESDYFTAVDDLKPATASGAGFLSMQQLTSGVFYWHANVNTTDLAKTWQRPEDRDDARARLIALFDALFLALPVGNQNTSAGITLPSLVLAVPAKSAISLQTAFESPVTGANGGYLTESMERLLAEHWMTYNQKPSLFADHAAISARTLENIGVPDGMKTMNLDDLSAYCADLVLDAMEESA